MTVGIDANIVVYAGLVPRNLGNAGESAAQEALTRRAKILLHDLRDQQVVLPMVAVSEVLVPVPQSKHGPLMAVLKTMFVCADFDEQAAMIAAGLWAQYKNLAADRKYDNRIALRADVKIIATAKAKGATVFYTHDDDCRALADLIMKGKGLPKGSEELFIDQMLAEGGEERPSAKKNSGRRQKRRP